MADRTTRLETPRETLRHEHEMLDGLCNDLINRAESGDCRECDAVWDELSRVLEAHMSSEETSLLPVFGAEGPEQAGLADRIRREHGDIRRTVERLGIAAQVHTLRADDVRELVEMLRRHAALEDASLYAWADRVLPTARRPHGFASEAPLGQAEPNLPPDMPRRWVSARAPLRRKTCTAAQDVRRRHFARARRRGKARLARCLKRRAEMSVTLGATTAQQSAEAVIVRRGDHTPSLATFWVRPRGEPFAFRPGQYLTLGLRVDGAPLERHYSIASAPQEAAEGYELYIRRIDGGALTPRLWRLGPGDALSLRGPKGKFVVRPADEGTLLFVCTSTGVAPFLSMIKAMAAEGRPRPIVVVQGVSYPSDLTHAALFARWREQGLPVTYVPTVSRPAAPESAGWGGGRGRVEAVLASVVEAEGLRPEGTVAFLCGNPGMVDASSAALDRLGFPRERVRRELYWAREAKPAPTQGEARAHEVSP